MCAFQIIQIPLLQIMQFELKGQYPSLIHFQLTHLLQILKWRVCKDGTLEDVDLTIIITVIGNQINSGVCESMGKALKENKTLKSLDLHGNKINNDGLPSVFEALNHNSSLQSFYLSGKHV